MARYLSRAGRSFTILFSMASFRASGIPSTGTLTTRSTLPPTYSTEKTNSDDRSSSSIGSRKFTTTSPRSSILLPGAFIGYVVTPGNSRSEGTFNDIRYCSPSATTIPTILRRHISLIVSSAACLAASSSDSSTPHSPTSNTSSSGLVFPLGSPPQMSYMSLSAFR